MPDRREFLVEAAAVITGVAITGQIQENKNYPTKNKLTVEIMKCDVPNKNNRIYPRHVVEAAIKGKNEILGTMDMPTEAVVKFSEVSHKITDLKIVDIDNIPTLIGNVTILETPYGKIAKSLLCDGIKFAFRTAGIGTAKCKDVKRHPNEEEGFIPILTVNDDYKLISINMIPEGDAA